MFADTTFVLHESAALPPPDPSPSAARILHAEPCWICEVLDGDRVYDVYLAIIEKRPTYVIRLLRVTLGRIVLHEEPLRATSLRYRVLLKKAAHEFPWLVRLHAF